MPPLSSKERNKLAEKLLIAQGQIQPTLDYIEGLKDALRDACTGAGNLTFIETVAGRGLVEVKAGGVKSLKGFTKELVLDTFMRQPEPIQTMLIKTGVVQEVEMWSKSSKPAVSVKLEAAPVVLSLDVGKITPDTASYLFQ